MIPFKDIRMQTRLADSLLFFYIALSTNFLVYFFSKSHLQYLENNVFVKYLLGFITMLFSIYHLANLNDPLHVIIVATVLYIWFLMTTKLSPIFSILIIVLLAITFMINMKIYHLESIDYTKETKLYISKLKTIIMFIFIITITMTILGFIFYIL